MADNENGNLSDLALATPPNVPSSKSSDISIEEIGNEESESLATPLDSSTLEKDEQGQAEISVATESGDAVRENKECDSSSIEDKEELAKDQLKETEEQVSNSAEENIESSSKTEPQPNLVVAEVSTTNSVIEKCDEDDDFEDETIIERVIGLTEMFPPGLTKTVSLLGSGSVNGVKWVYSKGRNITWIVLSTAALLFLPVMIESERVGFEEMEKAKRQQILLGPSSAMSSAGSNAPLPPTI